MTKKKSVLSELGRGAARGARNIAAGIGDIADIPYSFARYPINEGLNALGKGRPLTPIGESIGHNLDYLTGGYTAPQNNAEKVTETVTRGLTGIPTGSFAGKVIQNAKYAPAVAQNVGKYLGMIGEGSKANVASTAASSGITQHMLNNDPENVLGALGLGALGGLGAGMGANAGKVLKSPPPGIGRRHVLASKVLKTDPEKARLSLESDTPLTVGDLSNSGIVKRVENIAENTPLSQGHIRKLRQEQLDKMQGTLEEGGFGSHLNPESQGEEILKGIREHQGTQQGIVQGLKNKLTERLSKNATVPEEVDFKANPQVSDEMQRMGGKSPEELKKQAINLIPLKNTYSFLEQKASKLPDMVSQKEFLDSDLGNIGHKLNEIGSQYGSKKVAPFEALDSLRKSIDDSVSTFGKVGNVTQGELKAARHAMQKDVGDYFSSLGPQAKKEWDGYNKFYSEYAKHDIPLMNTLYKKGDISDYSVFNSVYSNLKSDGQKVKFAYKALTPDSRNVMTNTFFNELGRDTKGNFSVFKLQEKFNKLPDHSQDVLKMGLPESSRKPFSNMMDLVGAMKDTKNFGNPSGTEYTKQLADYMKIGAGAVTGHAIGAGAVLPTVSYLLASKLITSQMLTNKDFIRKISKAAMASSPEEYAKDFSRLSHIPGGTFGKNLSSQVQQLQVESMREVQKKDAERSKLMQERDEIMSQKRNELLAEREQILKEMQDQGMDVSNK